MRYVKKILKYLGWVLLMVIILISLLFVWVNWPVRSEDMNAKLGVTFSSRYASDIGLDWKKSYLAMLDDLHVKKIRIPVYWDITEPSPGQYDFSAIDWQLDEAKKHNAEVILVVGQKVPRWPECAIPAWAKTSDQMRKTSLLDFENVVINRYKNNQPEIKYWQVENEPFLLFGLCPAPSATLLDSEISEVRRDDPTRQIIVTDSGELGHWIPAASRADVFGTTMYRTIYKEGWGYYSYPIGPMFFRLKYALINLFAHQNKAMVIELQAEPWVSGYTTQMPLSEQFKSMNVDKLKSNVEYARKVGFPEIYLWGVEWWYWLKVKEGHPELWNEAKILFSQNGQGVGQN
ncbi:MAG: beta-galactosidase [Candidatus Pacebacteria bacterium]|nr:beta-galactosidase [Candidatus Paceibacterota bacterium]MDR3582913.1 beta-galactosidase [Candidatus Paceibacterota bacterium]